MSDLTRRLDQEQALAEKAMDHIGRICTREDRWTMTVPARDDDSDLMLMQVAEDSHRAARAMRRVADLHQPHQNCHMGTARHCAHDGDDWPCDTRKAIEGDAP